MFDILFKTLFYYLSEEDRKKHTIVIPPSFPSAGLIWNRRQIGGEMFVVAYLNSSPRNTPQTPGLLLHWRAADGY